MGALRAFQTHRVRQTLPLDGGWDFLPECDLSVPPGERPASYTRRLDVPQCWESVPDLRAYRGVGWFRRELELPEPATLRLAFGGVSHTATVRVDGLKLGGHYDAFTPWDVVAPDLAAGGHEIVVRVDNTFGDHSALHIPNDYYTYGGITRPVEAQIISSLFLDRIMATPRRENGSWRLDVRVRVRNIGDRPADGALRVRVAGKEQHLPVAEVASGATLDIAAAFASLDVSPWSETSPRLYKLETLLEREGHVTDDLLDRVGFREITVDGEKLLLNGEEIHLRGFNRHEDHPTFGSAIPPGLMAHDLDLFRDMNANFLRTCHYPNDMRLLDLCDERGIYVWEESHSRQTPFDHPAFHEQIRCSTVEMVENHFNHPCILMWGSLNECDTRSEAGHAVHAEVMGWLRELDGSRPVTYAANHRKEDLCLGLVDIVSWNLYTGWYGDPPEKTGEVFDDLLEWLDSDASRGGKGKPVILSEFGGGALPGCRSVQADFWSEDYQALLLDETLKAYLSRARIVGAAIWQFCDVRVSREKNPHPHNSYGPIGRPRTMNNKGVVDECRRPKLAYDTVKRHFHAAEDARGRV